MDSEGPTERGKPEKVRIEDPDKIDLISIKYFISQMRSPDKLKTNEPDFLPLFSNDGKNDVIGTQLVFHMENKEYGTRIVNLENFAKDDY